jgi:hypothetical protein
VVIDVLARFRKMVGPGKLSYEADYEAIAELQKIASGHRRRLGPTEC